MIKVKVVNEHRTQGRETGSFVREDQRLSEALAYNIILTLAYNIIYYVSKLYVSK